MAYCKKCGAYIPDGQGKCLACGFDEAEDQKAAAAAAAAAAAYTERAQAPSAEEIRARVEQRRAKRQEYDRAWAANEQRHRRMEQEFQQRQQAAEEQAESHVNRGGTYQRSVGSRPTEAENAGGYFGATMHRGLAALSYMGPLFLIPLLMGTDDEFVKFHAKQGARLFAYSAIGSVIGSIFAVGWIISILGVVLAIKGVSNALQGVMAKLPILDKLNWF